VTPEIVVRLINDPHTPTLSHELVEPIRWYELKPDIIADEGQWQALLDDTTVQDLELRLSLEQACTVHASGPVLLRGTAGSGKTTVSVYRLARTIAQEPDARVLYVTYSRALLVTVKKLFHDLYAARRLPLPDKLPEFHTFPDLYRRICGDSSDADELLRFPVFAQWYKNLYGDDDAALAWEEIRGIIKGACLDTDRDALDFEDYEELGRKRAPLFVKERPRLYRVFRQYRNWCQAERRHDDIDLARRALQAMSATPDLHYGHVICDEGQDLTEIEQWFLIKICREPSGLFLAADPQQIVNPSGFRWAEIRSLLRRHNRYLPVPEILSLTRNYRSVESIVALANALIRVQRDRTGRSDDDELQKTTLRGAMPVLVFGAEQEVLEHLRGFGPRCAVITANPQEATRLGAELQSTRVFDISSSKGLEFDGCVLWNVLGSDAPLWNTILNTDEPLKEDPVARRAIHHAYVAVTRARRYLGVYEASESAVELWQSTQLRSQIEADVPDALAKFMLCAASPGQWSEEGDYFLARGRYRQAAECYRRAGDDRKELEASAHFHESVEEFREAARIFERLALPDKAAHCLGRLGQHGKAGQLFLRVSRFADAGRAFEQAKQFKDAAEAYRRADDIESYRRCLLNYYVQSRDWREAGKLAEKAGDVRAAIDYFERAGLTERAHAARLSEARSEQNHAGTAELLEQSADFAAAADEYQLAGDFIRASRCRAIEAERRGDFQQAIELWRKAGDEDNALLTEARLCEKNHEWLEAAEIHDGVNDRVATLRCLRKSNKPRARDWKKALEKMDDRPGEAAEIFEDLGNYTRAYQLAEPLTRPQNVRALLTRKLGRETSPATYKIMQKAHTVVERYEMRQLWSDGKGDLALKHPLFDRDGKTMRLRAAIAENIGNWNAAAGDHESLKDFERAEYCYRKGDNTKKILQMQARNAEAKSDFTAAAEFWFAGGHQRNGNKFTAKAKEQAHDHEGAAEYYDRAKMPAQARRCRDVIAASQPPVSQPELFDEG